MRTKLDAMRSLARYISECLGEDWDVGVFAEQGTFSRPAVAVRTAGPMLTAGARHTLDNTLPVAIYAYPEEGESVEGGFTNAHAVEDLLWQAFNVGIGEGHPWRVPLYDYDGVPIDEGSELRRYPDYLRVVDFSIDATQSPEDEMKWTVVLSLRVTWKRSGELPTGKRLVTAIKPTITPQVAEELVVEEAVA